MIDIQKITKNLERKTPAIWVGPALSKSTYPESGHVDCQGIEETSFWFQHRSQSILAAMRRFPPPGVLFDIGGGNGTVSLNLEKAGIETVLVEPGEKGAAHAEEKGLKNIICSTLEDSGLLEGSISAVGLFDVLEHQQDEKKFLTSVYEVLKDQGLLYLTVPAYPFLWSTEDDYTHHYRRYTLKSLHTALSTAGFGIVYQTYFFSILPLPIYLLRTLPSRWGWRKEFSRTKNEQEHRPLKGLLERMMELIFKIERLFISKGKTIPFGASCLVIAKKIKR